MTQYTLDEHDFDFSHIFIGRERQLNDFEAVVYRWQRDMARARESNADETPFTGFPSPEDRIQGLVVMLYGHGGFGKSTLLRRFYEQVTCENEQAQSKLTICPVINWESIVEQQTQTRSVFNPPPDSILDASAYFRTLCSVLSTFLDKSPRDFRTYQQVAENVKQARQAADKALDELKHSNDENAKAMRSLTIDTVTKVLETVEPRTKAFIESETAKKVADVGLQFTQERVTHLAQHFRRRLADKLADFLDPGHKLAVAFGKDLAYFARNYPILFFFDTYEEADEGDPLLRIVMSAAGLRVGWVIAGRDTLWSGPGQRKRSIVSEYGYSDIVLVSHSLPINFTTKEVGPFNHSEVKAYFDQLCKNYWCEPPLIPLTEQDVQAVLEVTDGIPLAVKIAAKLYSERKDLRYVTDDVGAHKEIIDSMVQRYLLHTRLDAQERAPLYAIAMLRRPQQRASLTAALGLTLEEASKPTRFDAALSRLHRRYSFVFTEDGEPTLHDEVRKYLRLWLLERSDQPDIRAINERLLTAHEQRIVQLEEQHGYTTLKERMQDTQWTETYLDMLEQRLWLDPDVTMRSLLPFMIAASIYQRTLNKDVKTMVDFFAGQLHEPYDHWWQLIKNSLIHRSGYFPANGERRDLEEILKLLKQGRLKIVTPFS